MKLRRILIASAILIACGAGAASAQGLFPAASGGGPLRALVRKMIVQLLDLSGEQQTQIQGVLQSYRPDVRERMTKIGAAQKSLMKTIHSDQATEEDVRAASRALAAEKEELDVLRSQIVKKIRPVLTTEQKKKAQSFLDELPGPVDFMAKGESA